MDWFSILEAARQLSEDGFTAEELAQEAEIEGTEISKPAKIASAWLSKFHRWGYVLQAGTASSGRRWVRVWKLTDWGFEYEPGKDHGKKTRTGKPRTKAVRKVAANPKRKKR